jgi:group I intron endonuclease
VIGYIYKITNIVNEKIYIGQRKRDYEKDKKYFGSGKIIRQAIKKYGISNFKKELLEECISTEELNLREKYWIKELNSLSPIGYNISIGGHFGDTFTNNPNKEETREKQSKLKFGQTKENSDRVRKMSDTKKLQPGPNLNKKFTEEHIKNLSLSHLGKKNNLGFKHTEETKAKMSLKKKGKKLSEKHILHIKESYKEGSKDRGNNPMALKILVVGNNKIYSCKKEAMEDLNIKTSRTFEKYVKYVILDKD